MDKNVVDALKTLLEALPEEVVTEVTSKLNPSASHIPEENSKQLTAKARLLNFRLTEAYEEILEVEAIRTGQSKTTVLKNSGYRLLVGVRAIMDDNSTSVTSKEDVQDISLKNWLKNKKTIVLLIFTALTNVGNVLSTIDIITDKTSSFYTWLGESKKFEGHWTNNTEGFIDGTPDFLLKNAGDVLIKFDLNIKGGEVRGELHTDARLKMCETIEEKLKTLCTLIASHPLMIEGEKSPFSNEFDAYITEYRNGDKKIVAILNMKITDDDKMTITNTMRTPESALFPTKIYAIKIITEE